MKSIIMKSIVVGVLVFGVSIVANAQGETRSENEQMIIKRAKANIKELVALMPVKAKEITEPKKPKRVFLQEKAVKKSVYHPLEIAPHKKSVK